MGIHKRSFFVASAIAFLLLLPAFSRAVDEYFFYSKTFTSTPTTVTFKNPAGTNFSYRWFNVCNKDGSNSLYFTYDGSTAVANDADPSTNRVSIEVTHNWCVKVETQNPKASISVVTSSGQSVKGMVWAKALP